VVQRDIKIMKKTMKKSRSRQAETGSNEKIERTTSPGPGVGTRCCSRIFQLAKPFS
jgi:hypothetical protein